MARSVIGRAVVKKVVQAPAAPLPILATAEPRGDRVVIVRDEADKYIGNILLPDSVGNKTCRGTVIAVGPDVNALKDGAAERRPLKKGDRVLFTPYAGSTVDDNGSNDTVGRYIIMRAEDVWAFLPN